MNDFTLPMKKREKIAGWIYLPIHTVLMGLFILPVVVTLLQNNGITLDSVQVNTIYYCIGLAYILIFMTPFLKENFVMKKKANMLSTVGIGYFANTIMNYVVTIILALFTTQLTNPNSEAVYDAVSLNAYNMFAVAAIMAPIVEEVLFRGVIFGTIRQKSRILAYVVSILLFSVYHLWTSVALNGDWSVLIYMIQYVPAGLTLAWSYEKTGSIWTSIFLHMTINAVAVFASMAM